MRKCPFDGCGKPIPEERFACPRHWFSLSTEQQKMIWKAYRGYMADVIDIDELRRIQFQVLTESQA